MFEDALQNGKRVEYHEDYYYDGVSISVKTQLTPMEKKEFKRKLQSERDLVGLHFGCECASYCS